MEEDQNTQRAEEKQPETQPSSQESNSNGVSFPTVNQNQKKGGGKTILVIVALIIIAVLGYVIFRSSTQKSEEGMEGINPVETTEPAMSPESTPSETASPTDKSSVKIQIQNGTGITGEAGYLQDQLKALGYSNITVGNASSQTETATTVTFSSSLSSTMVDEITQKLKSLYATVNTKTSSSQSTDVVVVTGLRKGATAKPSSSPAASSTPSASSSPTPSPTASPTI